MDPGKTIIVLGPPGTGKTTELMRRIEIELAAGVDPRKIAFISFTRKAAEVARSRATQRFNLDEESLPYFRTIHSLAFKQLGVKQDEVLQRRHYRELGRMLSMDLDQIQEMDDEVVAASTTGSRIVFVENLARTLLRPVRSVWEDDPETDIEWLELERYGRALEIYKRSRAMVDFTDLLHMFVERRPVPRIEVLVVDEAQDLSPSQWQVVELLADQAERIYVAGDDDQAIYKWSGADVKRFVELPGRVHQLAQSYRIPGAVHQVAESIASRIHVRRPKSWAPREEVGHVEWVSGIDELDMSSGTWFLLARNGYMLAEMEKDLLRAGIPFESTWGLSPLHYKSLRAIREWEGLRKGNHVTAEIACMIYSYIREGANRRPGSSQGLMKLPKDHLLGMQSLTINHGLLNTNVWYDTLDGISPTEKEFYLAARRRGESLVREPRVKLSTIHRVKGDEKDHVVLVTDVSAKVYNEMQRDPDDEGRVFYVGATRALKSLHIVVPQTDLYYEV